ncbi:M67 family metallopeptidase [Cyanobium sp. NIES-981]|uniref:M67 family metallopeptidase n=1 Tax=Cyanobium sp. NIES-981 TaxID=1851505 RepID=UPI001CECA0D4|nr:M67 family metallopeptidase [Cyanobium sp. NIES-981]
MGVDPDLLTVLVRLLTCAAPDEGCALLLGRRFPAAAMDGGSLWHLERVWPCLNVWPRPGERGHRFAIDPREQLVAQRWSRPRGLAVLGAAHSHPAGPARPSPTDRALTLAPALMVIVGRDGDPCAWWLEEGEAPPRPLPWRMGD